MELAEYFTFFVPKFQFNPDYKAKLWDGKIRLLNLQTRQLYFGLWPYIEQFAQARNYQVVYNDDVRLQNIFRWSRGSTSSRR
jgi:hypothetical protein